MRLLVKFWIILIPLVVFLIWFVKNKHLTRGDKILALRKAIIWTLTLAMLSMAYIFFTSEDNSKQKYTAPSLQNGQVIDGKFN